MSKRTHHIDLPEGLFPAIARRLGYFSTTPTSIETRDWSGNVFVAPPKAEARAWLERAHEATRTGEARQVCCVVPSKPHSQYWLEIVWPYAEVYFVVGLQLAIVVYRNIKKPAKPTVAGLVESGGVGSWAFL